MNEIPSRPVMPRLPAGALEALRRSLAEGRSPTEAAEQLRRVGYESGPEFHRALEERLTGGSPLEAMPGEAFWRGLSDFFEDAGWGRLEFEQPHAGVAALHTADWAESHEGERGAPSCHFTTGLLAEVLGRVAEADLAVLEVECRSAGAERCRFLLGGRGTLEQVYEGLRGGASVESALGRLG